MEIIKELALLVRDVGLLSFIGFVIASGAFMVNLEEARKYQYNLLILSSIGLLCVLVVIIFFAGAYGQDDLQMALIYIAYVVLGAVTGVFVFNQYILPYLDKHHPLPDTPPPASPPEVPAKPIQSDLDRTIEIIIKENKRK